MVGEQQKLKILTLSDMRRCFWSWGVPKEKIENFIRYFCEFPIVWREFERLTLEAISRGEVCTSKGIFEELRKSPSIRTSEAFKINNIWSPYYARAFAIKFPQHRDYFEFRQVKGLRAA